MMKKDILAFLFFFLSGLLSFSRSSAQSSAEARKILDKFYETYEQSQGVAFSFEITTIDANGVRYRPQQGEAMMKGDKFKLDMNTVIIWFDGKTQWVLLKDVGEVNISTPSAKEVAYTSPLALLRLYKSGYTLKKPISVTVNGKSAYVIEMVPTTSHSDFKQLSVAVDKKTHTILQIKTTLKNDQTSIIDIKNYNDNHNFPDSVFVFDKADYPDVEVVDLR
jgi:outer membrane lipoprotein-sorting protein